MFPRGLDFRTRLRKSNFLSQDEAFVVATFAAALGRCIHSPNLDFSIVLNPGISLSLSGSPPSEWGEREQGWGPKAMGKR